MKFRYDKNADALYIRFNDKRYSESDEVSEGILFDYNRNGKIIGIEILNASKKFPKEFHAKFRQKRFPVSFALAK